MKDAGRTILTVSLLFIGSVFGMSGCSAKVPDVSKETNVSDTAVSVAVETEHILSLEDLDKVVSRTEDRDTYEAWDNSEDEIWILDDLPEEETVLYGIKEDGRTKLILRIGDVFRELDRDFAPYRNFRLYSGDYDKDDMTEYFLCAGLRDDPEYYNDLERSFCTHNDMYIIETDDKNGTVIYSFSETEKVCSRLKRSAQMMGFMEPNNVCWTDNSTYGREGIYMRVYLWDEGSDDRCPNSMYNVAIDYRGDGLFVIGNTELTIDMAKG